MEKYNTEIFIEKAKLIHGNKYDYSKTIYKNANTKIEIICPVHNSFYMKPSDHIGPRACGCPKCSIENKYSNNEKNGHLARITKM